MDHTIASTSSNRSAEQEEVEAVGVAVNSSVSERSSVSGNVSRPADLFALFSSGYMKTCPYDTNHIVRETRFSKHVMKCRYDFVISQAGEGREVLMLPCRYNPDHKVLAQELAYHEDFCPDKAQTGRLATLLEENTEDEEDVVVGGYDTQLETAQEDVAPNQPEDNTQSRRRGRSVPVADLQERILVRFHNYLEDDDDWLPLPLRNPPESEGLLRYMDPYYYARDYDYDF